MNNRTLIRVETYKKQVHDIVMSMVRNIGNSTYIPNVYITDSVTDLDSLFDDFKVIRQNSYYIVVGYPKDTWRNECRYVRSASLLGKLI